MAPKIIIITGATASGKSSVALQLAQKTGGVIINADSQQLYAELRILTARPTPEEEALAPHKLYGILPAAQAASAGKWLQLARMEIDWALSQNRPPIVTGGTGLYLKALTQGIAEVPDVDSSVRAQAHNDYKEMGKEAFAARLSEVDPAFFTRLKVYDRQRLLRAYEVWLGTGKPLSFWQQQTARPPYPIECFDIHQVSVDRAELYRRCDARFLKMLEEGALEEVKQLLSMNLSPDLPAMKSVGVTELAAYLRSEITRDAAISAAQQATRNYAKRQLTWFRHQFPGLSARSAAEILNSIDQNRPKH